MTMRLLIVLSLLWIVGDGTGSSSIAAEKSGGLADESVEAPLEKPPEPAKEPLRRLEERLEDRLHGATPEEHARLDAERKRLSADAAAFGTDPTAIIGYYQLNYGHSVFTNNLRIDSATATIRLPITPNWLFQVNMPYVWTDLNQPRGSTMNGTSDMTTRTGGRIFANEDVALFLGFDAALPTASEQRLGTGKYILGPGGSLAAPLPRIRSIFYLLAANYNSVGGDPSRANLHYTQVQSAVNTIWSDHWWSSALMIWDVDWNHGRKETMNLQGEIGHRFDNHWNVYAGHGVGVVGRETFLGLDWTVQAGVRWVFKTPLIPERVFESLPRQ
jgi:hypothetical protein